MSAHGVLLPDPASAEINFSAVKRSNRRSGSVITLKTVTEGGTPTSLRESVEGFHAPQGITVEAFLQLPADGGARRPRISAGPQPLTGRGTHASCSFAQLTNSDLAVTVCDGITQST
jgi:hypothetical protein